MKLLKILLAFSLFYCFIGCKAVSVSPEMKEFTAAIGDKAKLETAISKYAEEGVFPKEIKLCDLEKPVITKQETKDGETVYTVEARVAKCERSESAEGTIRIFMLGWKDKKIVSFKWGGPKSGKVEY